MFLEISQNSQENTCARVSFLIKLQVIGIQMWPKPLIRSSTSSSGSSLQKNKKIENMQVKMYFIIDMRVSKSLHF